jgi:Flp pilus assembly protein TadG
MMLLLGRFGGERSGNIAVTFTLALIPILSGVGYAIDYAMTMRIEAKLQSAADAASVAAASQQSPGYTASLAMISDGNVPAGATDANNILNGNSSALGGYTGLALSSARTRTGVTLTSTVSYSANVPTIFLGVIGRSAMTISWVSKSTSSPPPISISI